jgi:hypothetical protein
MEALLDASKEAGIEVTTEKTKYIFLLCHQTTGQNQYIRTAILWKCGEIQI